MKTIKKLCLALLVICMVFSAFACGGSGADDKEYKIIYVDDGGSHTINVKSGEIYQVEQIPQRLGYDFTGLFDAETGGKQYVHANGVSLAAFSDTHDVVLYPQYRAKEYTVELDYRNGASASGITELTVAYNERIQGLPTDLTLSGKSFDGWYNAPEDGEMVCDADGNVTLKGKLTESNYDIANASTFTLYARFVTRKLTVKLYFDESQSYTTVEVDYNAVLSDIVPVRDVNGKLVSAWSTERGDAALDHKVDADTTITSDITLYAAQYSTYIAFDSNGGGRVAPIVAAAGSTVNLPTPQKTGYVFLGWKLLPDETLHTTATVGERGTTYTASWRGIEVTLNSDGASNVPATLQVGADGAAALPVPVKPNYVFCGWFDAAQNYYWNTISPTDDVTLTAKWVAARIVHETNKWSEEYNGAISNGTLFDKSKTWVKTQSVTLPSELNNAIAAGKVKVDVNMKLKVWVRTKGNATATVKITAKVNDIVKDGPTMSATGGGYSGIFGENPVDGPIRDEVRSSLEYTFTAPQSAAFDIVLTYKMDSNKDNSKVSTDVHFLCEELTVTVSNI